MNNINDHKHLIGLSEEDAMIAAVKLGFKNVRSYNENSAISLEHCGNRLNLVINNYGYVVNVWIE